MKIVFDTNVIISSTLWNNSIAHKLLIDLLKTDIEFFTSLEILNEYKRVLKRDFKYSEDDANKFLDKILEFMKIVSPSIKLNEIKEDPADNKVLECAIESN